jgi:pyrroloquinoline quinone (PQQ) biosynthesis protein C
LGPALPAPATGSDFRAELWRAVREPAVEHGRFFRLLESDADAQAALREYALRLYQGVHAFARRLYAICSVVPHADARVLIAENVLEEEGFVPTSGRLVLQSAASHRSLAERFARACGLGDAELAAAVQRLPRGWFEDAIQEGRWLAAMAYLLVGVEGNGAPACRALLANLQRRGFAAGELAFFELHGSADEEHSAVGLTLVERFACDVQQRTEALAAAARGARDFRLLHERCLRPRQG